MQKRHFEALAAALKDVKPAPVKGNFAILTMWESTVQAVANVAAAKNPRFDRARFLRAAGFEKEVLG